MTDSIKPTPCPEREDALALHAGRDLPPAEARELEAHLGSCPGCRRFLDELEESQSALAALASETSAAGLVDMHRRVMEAVRADAEGGEESRPFDRGRPWRWAAAAVVVLALGAAFLWYLGPDTETRLPGAPHKELVWIARSEPPESPGPPSIPPTPDARAPLSGSTQSEPTRPESTPREPRPTAPTHETEIRRASTDDRPDLKIQLVSDDPDIVIYWLVDMEETTDAPTDATSTT